MPELPTAPEPPDIALATFAARHRITLHKSRATDEEQLNRAVIIWTATGTGMAIIPAGQDPADTLVHLRDEVGQRLEDLRQAEAFQASVASGYVEDLDTWHARTSQAPQ